MVAHVTFASKQHRLREQVLNSHIRHDETVRADISGVRVASQENGAIVSFSDVEPIRVRRRLTTGDNQPIPQAVAMEGFDFPGDGVYDLKDVVVRCNGDLRIVADSHSRVEPHANQTRSILDEILVTLSW